MKTERRRGDRGEMASPIAPQHLWQRAGKGGGKPSRLQPLQPKQQLHRALPESRRAILPGSQPKRSSRRPRACLAPNVRLLHQSTMISRRRRSWEEETRSHCIYARGQVVRRLIQLPAAPTTHPPFQVWDFECDPGSLCVEFAYSCLSECLLASSHNPQRASFQGEQRILTGDWIRVWPGHMLPRADSGSPWLKWK